MNRYFRIILLIAAAIVLYYSLPKISALRHLSPIKTHDGFAKQSVAHENPELSPGGSVAAGRTSALPSPAVLIEDDKTAVPTPVTAAEDERFSDLVYPFMADLPYEQPSVNVSKLAVYRPHNYNGQPGGMAFATYFGSRITSLHDPYFMATQLLVYRTLWSLRTASKKYPIIVFVAPFVSEEQRNLLLGAGAIVRELPLVEWNPTTNVHGRWRDLFSKIHMWGQTDFSRIAFLDADTFPMFNLDDIFEVAQVQNCKSDLLMAEEGGDNICEYVFASAPEPMSPPSFNVGVTVFSPNTAMHHRLLSNFARTDMYDNTMAEQAFLNWQFGHNSAFPVQMLDRTWNGCLPGENEEGKLKIVHGKLWLPGMVEMPVWLRTVFGDGWKEMVGFYESHIFKSLREAYGLNIGAKAPHR